jgi:2-hydroxy fatty acid dioxygenase
VGNHFAASSTSMKGNQPQTFLEKSFGFYASYHDNFMNQLIHVICVWPIFWTAVLFFQYTPEIEGLQWIKDSYPGCSCTWVLPLAALYFFFYLFVELPGIVGPLCSGIVLFSYLSTEYVKNTYSEFQPWRIATVVHILCWIAQFYGHGVYEGRAPALLDNLFGAIVMAPLFVTMEVFFMFGYKSKFRQRISEIVKVNKKAFEESSQKKK